MNLIRLNNFFFFRPVLSITCIFIYCWSAAQTTADSSAGVVETAVDTTATDVPPNYFDSKPADGRADTIELRHVPAYVMDSLKNDDAFWYANTKIKKKQEKESTPNSPPHWVKNLAWIMIVGVFLAAMIWYLATSNILIFAKRQKQILSDDGDNEAGEDIFSINYQRQIENAILAQDYRLAIRLMFLRLLKNLSDRNLIQYRQGKTNLEYLSQLFSTGYYNDFFRLTRNYEYAWYGKFDVGTDAFKTIKKDFENFDERLK